MTWIYKLLDWAQIALSHNIIDKQTDTKCFCHFRFVLTEPKSRRLIKETYKKDTKLEERELRRLRLTNLLTQTWLPLEWTSLILIYKILERRIISLKRLEKTFYYSFGIKSNFKIWQSEHARTIRPNFKSTFHVQRVSLEMWVKPRQNLEKCSRFLRYFYLKHLLCRRWSLWWKPTENDWHHYWPIRHESGWVPPKFFIL